LENGEIRRRGIPRSDGVADSGDVTARATEIKGRCGADADILSDTGRLRIKIE
jgi:hypothetical protein